MTNILYFCCYKDLSGYGEVARNHLRGLLKFPDLKIRIVNKRFQGPLPLPLKKQEQSLFESAEATTFPDKEKYIVVQHLTPENYVLDTRALCQVSYCPAELNALPLSWRLPLKAMEFNFSPSKHSMSAYTASGLSENNHFIIPHGVDTDKFNPDIPALKYEKRGYNFGSVFDWTERKDPHKLIHAYYSAFTDKDDVSLTLRVFYRFPYEKTLDAVKNRINSIKSGYTGRNDFPPIYLWTDEIDEDLMPNFYKTLDCFVLVSRGEAWGLPYSESMSMEIPTIGPAWGGNTDFMTHNKNSVLIPGKVVPIDNTEFLQYNPQYNNLLWFDADLTALKMAMLWTYKHREKAKQLGIQARKDMIENWAWNHTCAKLRGELVKLWGQY